MKPRLYFLNGQWSCACTTWCGRGDSPFQAWMSWLKLSLSRYDFETQP
jgi:hypothetical protein